MSPTGTISVLPAAFNSAATTCAIAHKTVTALVTTLAKTLVDNWGCAGTDNTGHSFANSYDPAAFNAVTSGSDIANALGKLYDLLKYTSINHANGNTAAATDPKPANIIPGPLPIPAYVTPTFKGAYGGDTDAPFGWGLITRWLQGRVWPNGHQDGLDRLSHAWTTAKDGLNGTLQGLKDAREVVDQQISDEVPQILTQIDLVVGDITNLANHCEILSTACWDYSTALTKAHNEIGRALAEFVLTVSVTAAISSLIGPEGTAGGAALAAGVRGEATAARVITIIDALSEAVTAKNVALAGSALAAGRLTGNLQPLLDSKPTRFDANTRPGGEVIKPKPFRDKDSVSEFDGEQAAQDLRDFLAKDGNQLKLKKNVAVGEAEIDGQYIPSRNLRAVSGEDPPPSGTLGEPKNPVFNPADQTGNTVRPTDSEYKILENLATRLTPDSKGVVNIYTEAKPCDACTDVIQQFETKFPGVKLNVTYSVPGS
ncbi:deaminase domain-containing protein [Nocardia tengchongensis]|uniref:deaminase domain-containing protein n=1 Tax=Nocardia tengchongensis TaxID=2055889 RepID=UPI0036B2B910